MNTVKNLIIKYKELIVYVIFGACTTLVNFITYKLFNMLLGVEFYLVSNIVAWFVSVVFAYITNKLFVFESKSWNVKTVAKEVPSFFAARVFSFVVEEAGLFLLVDIFGMKSFGVDAFGFRISGNMISKILLAVVVVVLNYFFSKFVVFRKKATNNSTATAANSPYLLRRTDRTSCCFHSVHDVLPLPPVLLFGLFAA